MILTKAFLSLMVLSITFFIKNILKKITQCSDINLKKKLYNQKIFFKKLFTKLIIRFFLNVLNIFIRLSKLGNILNLFQNQFQRD